MISAISVEVRRFWTTYKWASRLTRFDDINLVPEPINRCRYFSGFGLTLAVVASILLMMSLSLNALDISHGINGYAGINRFALAVIEDWASVFPHTSLSNPTVSRQTLAFSIALILSSLYYGLIVLLGVRRGSATASRYQQLVFSSFIASLCLIRYSAVTLSITILVCIARWLDFDFSSSPVIFISIVLLTYFACFAWSHLANRTSRRRGAPGPRNDDAPLAYSLLTPVLINFAVLCSAAWTNDHFDSRIMLQTSDACGAPDNGACTLYIRPHNANGTIFLDKITVHLAIMFDEASDFVGPRYITSTQSSFRMIETPDSPLPVRVGADATRGVVGHIDFQCPTGRTSHKEKNPKIHVFRYSASAFSRALSEAEPERRMQVPVTFEHPSDVLLVFRNSAKGCMLIP
ncbi:hypothetical protein [Burkholderia sp. BCC0419]|uniref:hypothetical protein n=1 Tax=Burkholderia sp. BCC0419 TaxID=486878 RepID=UPI00158A74A5|nr:hypothetical protein [Burkholderia sp. BCC0419]